MTKKDPIAKLEPQFSSPEATPTAWKTARQHLEKAEIFWLATVRPDGRPHVTPLIAVLLDDILYFCTGEGERKAKNLAQNAHCILTTGCNFLNAESLDVVIEGEAVRVNDGPLLQRIADLYETKYGQAWHFTVRNNALYGATGNVAVVYKVAPTTAFGFGRGATSSQTRWNF